MEPSIAERIAQIRMVLRRQWLTPTERLELEKTLTQLHAQSNQPKGWSFV